MSAYLLAVVLVAALSAWATTGRTHLRRSAWVAGAAAFGVLALWLGVRTLSEGRSVSLLIVLTALLAYVAWPVARWMREPAAVPHWTVGAAAGLGALVLEGHTVSTLMGSHIGWAVQLIVLGIFALVAPTTIAWTIVAGLWLRHRAVPRAERQPVTAEVGSALMEAPTQRLRSL